MIVAASQGPAPLTVLDLLTSWRPDPLALLLVVLLGGGYLWARRRVAVWPRARSLAFYGVGLGSLLLVSVTFVGVYDDVLFWTRSTQIIVLLMVTPLGLAMGGPLSLLRQGLGEGGRARLDRAVASRGVRLATHPAAGSVLMLTLPWLLYFTAWYPTVLRNSGIDALTRLALVAVGFVYFYGRLQLDPVPRRYPHLIAFTISLTEVIFDAALGLVLWLGPQVALDYYAALGRTWGPSLRDDQIYGAGILWIGGDLAGLPFLAALLRRMIATDSEEAAEVDRQLDEAETAPTIPTDPANADPPPGPRLWWEDDPQLSQRFHRSGAP